MSERTDEQLIRIVSVEREKYNPEALEAADAEFRRRNIDPSLVENTRSEAETANTETRKVNGTMAGSGQRFLNFIIDSLILLLLWSLLIPVLDLVYQPLDQTSLQLYTYGLGCIIFTGYYTFMEIKFRKTVGKFITKTKVVKNDGQLPSNSDIFTRTFCRFIPFDRFSFLFVKNGFHDRLSETRVIKD